MTVVVSTRVSDEVGAWLAEYAAARGVSRGALVETALEGFMEDCRAGVPEIRERAKRQAYAARQVEQGVGECRKSKVGHVWETADGAKRCRFCQMPARAFLAEFCGDRAAFFSSLKPPMTSGTGKPPSGGKA